MDFLTQALGLLLSLSILIILHEGGHFAFAKLFKTRVEKFYLFFDPWFSVFKVKRGETEYGLGWIPLGGYVKISGMIDESMDMEQMKQPPKPWEFRSKSTWQRLLIMLGGVLVNFLVALLIYSMILFIWGREYIPVANLKNGVVWDSLVLEAGAKNGDKVLKVGDKEVVEFGDITKNIVTESPRSITVMRNGKTIEIPLPEDFVQQIIAENAMPVVLPAFPFIIDSVMPDKPAEKAGFLKNDKIIKINGDSTPYYTNVIQKISTSREKTVAVTVLRSGEQKNLDVTVNKNGLIGIYNKPPDYYVEFARQKYGFLESIPAGITMGINTLSGYVKQMKLLFTKEGAQNLGGFGTIGGLFPKTWDWVLFWERTAFLSIILAFMNILPIPALDGGHVTFLLYEMVTGRKPGEKFLEYAQLTGLILLIGLVLFANANDLIRWISSN